MKTGGVMYKYNRTDSSNTTGMRETLRDIDLCSVHDWVTDIPHPQECSQKAISQVLKGSFEKQALIAIDMWGAYKMGDGDRAIRNAKVEMLCASAPGSLEVQTVVI